MDKARFQKLARYANRVDTARDPVSIQAAILDACFNKCPMCDHPSRVQHTIGAKRWIDFLSEHDEIESVCYSGGDAMAHPELNEIMEAHLSLGVSFSFITSGYVPPKIDLELLANARWVRVSLDTIVPEVYKIVRGGIPIAIVLTSLEKLQEARVNVEMTITVGRRSVLTLPETLEWVVKHGYNADMHPQYGLTYKDLGWPRSALDECVEYARREHGVTFAPYSMGGSGSYKCKAVFYQSFIDSLGDVYPCCVMAGDTGPAAVMAPLGNIDNWPSYLMTRQSFSDLLPKERPGECKNCIHRFAIINEFSAINQDSNSFF